MGKSKERGRRMDEGEARRRWRDEEGGERERERKEGDKINQQIEFFTAKKLRIKFNSMQ